MGTVLDWMSRIVQGMILKGHGEVKIPASRKAGDWHAKGWDCNLYTLKMCLVKSNAL